MLLPRIGLVAVVAAFFVGVGAAHAASNTIGFEYDFEIDDSGGANDGKHKNNVFVLSYSHAFDNNVSVGVSAQASNNVLNSTWTQQVEGTLGYKLPITDIWSVSASAGVGERFNDSTYGDFPYWVLRASTEVALSKKVTWQIIFARIRNAFDPMIAFDTPQVGTQLSVKVTDSATIYAKVYESWRNGAPDVTGIGGGLRYTWK